AVRIRNIEIVQVLLKNGAQVNEPNELTSTPLHYAAGRDLAIVEVLLENGADINVRDMGQLTPLHRAVGPVTSMVTNRELHKIVRLLLKQRADVSARDLLLMTPLHIAAARGDVELVKILLAYKADVDA
ncbi:ankyrin repeat-containing domain protein, partial [Phyllosticta citrichinensis]